MKSLLFLLVISLMVSLHESQSVTITLPVPQRTITKVTLSIQKLQELLKNFGTFFENKGAIYKRVELTKVYLHQMSQALAKYNSVIAGSGNKVVGNKNVVIGNHNNIEGSSNWVFVSQYTGQINGDLLVGQWRVQLDKSNLIPINTRFAISLLRENKNSDIRTKFLTSTRQLCKWDKWTNPANTKSNAHWGRYLGYTQWKTNFWQPAIGSWGNWSNNLFGSNLWGSGWGK